MAIDDAYTDAATYRASVSKTDSSQDAAILVSLKAISRTIEKRLGRFFTQDAAVVERLYYATSARLVTLDGMPALLTDEISTVTGLIVKVDEDNDGLVSDDTAWTINTDFRVWPLNAALGPEVKPYQAIAIPPSTSAKSFIANGLVSVTAKFGWPAVPSAIAAATIQLAGILRIESPRATGRVADSIDGEIDASDTAKKVIQTLLDTYGSGPEFS